MHRNPIIVATVLVCLTAILIAWSPWGKVGRYQKVEYGAVFDTATGKLTGGLTSEQIQQIYR